MQTAIPESNREVQEGKEIVENFLKAKKCENFQWFQDFKSRQWSVEFDYEGDRYESSISHVSLTNLKSDDQKESKLKILWEGKAKK